MGSIYWHYFPRKAYEAAHSESKEDVESHHHHHQFEEEGEHVHGDEWARKRLVELDSMDELHRWFLEVQRLDAPVAGGCRGVKKEVCLDKSLVQAGSKVWFSDYSANRDPLVFENPLQFDPSRWKRGCPKGLHLDEKNQDTNTAFGFGPRKCVGM